MKTKKGDMLGLLFLFIEGDRRAGFPIHDAFGNRFEFLRQEQVCIGWDGFVAATLDDNRFVLVGFHVQGFDELSK